MSNAAGDVFKALDDAEDRIVLAVKRAVRRFLGRATTMTTLGEMYGWWGDQVDSHIALAIRETWLGAYQTYANGVISTSSLDGLDEYMTKVKDRLVRGLDPPLPAHAFDLVRQAIVFGAAHGQSREQVAQQIAKSLGWEKNGDYWREQKQEATDAIDNILDGLGEPGNPSREWARLNDPQIQSLRDQSNLATQHLDVEYSYWHDRAIKIARTESTGAFNAAALSALHDEGWAYKKWLATDDTRTRESHRMADGQVVALTSPFRVGETLLMMPGDPTGAPDEVVNCRCAILGEDRQPALVASGYNAAQARVPKGNGRLSGRWIDMPWTTLARLLKLFPNDPSVKQANDLVEKSRSGAIWNLHENIRKAADLVRHVDLPAAQDLDDFASVDWYSDPDFDPEASPKKVRSPLIAALADDAISGGFTFDTRTLSQPSTGYVVALRGSSSITPASNKAEAAKQIKKFLQNPDPPSPIIGGWHDKEHNEIVLDYVEVVPDRTEAIRLGQENNQQAIFDLDKLEEIDTGGSGDRPGTVDNPIDVGSDVNKAAELISKGQHVRLQQVSEVSTLLDRLAELTNDAKAKGEKAPNYDLCLVSVPDTNLFCVGNKGIDRIDMPQLAGYPVPGSKADGMPTMSDGEVDLTGQFKQSLIDRGIAVTEETVPADHLRATQDQLVGAKVAGIAKAMDSAPPDSPLFEPIFVTKDNYVIDGHHRWAAEVARDIEDGKLDENIQMKVQRVDVGIDEVLPMAIAFGNDWGIQQQAADPAQGNAIPKVEGVPGAGWEESTYTAPDGLLWQKELQAATKHYFTDNSGNQVFIASDWTPEQVDEFLADTRRVLDLTGAKNVQFRIPAKGDRTLSGSTGGVTHAESRKITINPGIFQNRELSAQMRAEHPDRSPGRIEAAMKPENYLASTIAHEIGHIVENDNGDLANLRKENSFWREHKDQMGVYGKMTDAHEGYAEAYAQWVLDPDVQSPAGEIARAYAERYGWEKPIQGVPGETSTPQVPQVPATQAVAETIPNVDPAVASRFQHIVPQTPQLAMRFANPLDGVINCQATVTAYELRRRGLDVVAKTGDSPPSKEGWESYFNFTAQDLMHYMPPGNIFADPEDDIVDYGGDPQTTKKWAADLVMRDHGPGERGFMTYVGTSTGHIFVWEVTEDGTVEFLDPQTGQPLSDAGWRWLGRSSFVQVARTDDKVASDRVLHAVTSDQEALAAEDVLHERQAVWKELSTKRDRLEEIDQMNREDMLSSEFEALMHERARLEKEIRPLTEKYDALQTEAAQKLEGVTIKGIPPYTPASVEGAPSMPYVLTPAKTPAEALKAAKKYGLPPDEVAKWRETFKAAEKHQKQYPDSQITSWRDSMLEPGSLRVFIPLDNVSEILEAGRLENTWESGRSTGGSRSDSYLRDRRFTEDQLLGVPADTPDADRPIYGTADGTEGVLSFLPFNFTLKDDVKDRSTVSFSDSLNGQPFPIPYSELATASMDQLRRATGATTEYTEFQIFGGVSTNDIDHAELNLDDVGTEDYEKLIEVLDRLEEENIEVRTFGELWKPPGEQIDVKKYPELAPLVERGFFGDPDAE